MHFDERREGDYRIFAGALEAPQGDGYTAALIVRRWRGPAGTTGEIHRDETMACGHRWATAAAALGFAIKQGQALVNTRIPA